MRNLLTWLFGGRASSSLPTASAIFDTYSLFARYNFTLEEMNRAAAIRYGERLPDVTRAMFHELFHLYQTLATPYGYYYYCLRDLQGALASDAVRALQRIAPTKIRPPLIKLLRDAEIKREAQDVFQALAFCYNAELLLLFLQSEFEVYLKAHQSPILPLQTVGFRFLANEKCLVPLLQRAGRVFDYPGPQLTETSAEKEGAILVMKLLGGVDVRHILESAANVAEYWNHEVLPGGKIDHVDWAAERVKSYRPGYRDEKYWHLVLEAKNRLRRITNCNEFVYTYLAICDFALNSPLLPFHAGLRRGYSEVWQLAPTALFYRLLIAAGDLTPIRELETDYERFIGELAEATSIASPVELARLTVRGLKYAPHDGVTQAFHYAQTVRAEAPWAFLDHRLWIGDPPNDIIAGLRAIFIHPVMQYKDKTLYHKNKDIVVFYTARFILNTYFRKLLFSGDMVINLPFRTTPSYLKSLHEEARSALHATGVEGPDFSLRSA